MLGDFQQTNKNANSPRKSIQPSKTSLPTQNIGIRISELKEFWKFIYGPQNLSIRRNVQDHCDQGQPILPTPPPPWM